MAFDTVTVSDGGRGVGLSQWTAPLPGQIAANHVTFSGIGPSLLPGNPIAKSYVSQLGKCRTRAVRQCSEVSMSQL